MGYIDQTVRAVNLSANGTEIAPTVGNVLDGSYPLSRNLYYVTNGEATGLAKDFIAFTLSPEGQAIVEREGFVSVQR
jgi:phosphate transport system substrate-binding protein